MEYKYEMKYKCNRQQTTATGNRHVNKSAKIVYEFYTKYEILYEKFIISFGLKLN